MFAEIHGVVRKRFALNNPDKTNGTPGQGFTSPADAALDPVRRLSEDVLDQGEALFRIARSQFSTESPE